MKKTIKKEPIKKRKKLESSSLFPEPSKLVISAARMLDQKREELGISPVIKSFCMADNLLTSLEMENPSFQYYARKSVMIPLFFAR
jgi:hypothetical protein